MPFTIDRRHLVDYQFCAVAQKPTIFPITTCMGRIAHLQRCLPTLLEEFERVVLVDWSCPDQSGRWATRTFGSRVHVVEAPGHRHFHKTAAMNVGAEKAADLGASWFAFVDADTLAGSGLRQACEACARSGHFGLADRSRRDAGGGYSLAGFLLVSRADFERVGGYDDAFRDYGQDDLEMRCRLRLVGGLTPIDLPGAVLTSIPHEDTLRVQHYAEPDLRASDGRNAHLLHARVSAWTQHDVRDLPELDGLLCMAPPVRRVPLAPLVAQARVPGFAEARRSSWRRVGGRLVPRTLRGPQMPVFERAARVVSGAPPESRVAPSSAQPRVSAVIKATVLDTDFLAATVPHMLAQARFDFAERIVVVDRRPEFTGKYQDRPRSTRAALDEALASLVARNVIDRVLDVPTRPDEIEPVMGLYFGAQYAHRIPTHGMPGCPIFTTLFGLEAAPTDLVVQFDADMFFHADGTSWIEEGARVLEDPGVWLVMTHSGPPAGPLGARSSLGRANADRASWHSPSRTWRFADASTRYFLTDRRRLRNRLEPLWHGSGLRPLEECISAALGRHRACRANLAREGSWDLHGWDHGPPFPDWAERVARAVEEGRVPEAQRGIYDLRLDLAPFRRVWEPFVRAAGDARAAGGSARPRDALGS
jgi:hypothetical protein